MKETKLEAASKKKSLNRKEQHTEESQGKVTRKE